MTTAYSLRSLAIPMTCILVFGATLIPTTGAAAQDTSSERACAADMGKDGPCASVKAGGGRIRECLRDHLADLSKPCQEALLKAAIVKKACAADLKRNARAPSPEPAASRSA